MSLDNRFGRCDPPRGKIEEPELHARPLSRIELNTTTASMFRSYLSRQQESVTNAFSMHYHLLWLVDHEGRLFVATEELVDEAWQHIGALPRKRQAAPAKVLKLGHPTLLNEGQTSARIGGEIEFDPQWEQGRDWVLTNKSGRYGLRTGQKEAHLMEVKALFEQLDIHLGLRFIEPKEQS